MTQPNENLLQAASTAFGRGDLGAMADQFFAPDILWHLAGTGPLAGDYAGVAQVMRLLGKIRELTSGTIQHEMHDVLVGIDHTVALATIRGQRAGSCRSTLSMSSTAQMARRPRSGPPPSIPPGRRRSGRSAHLRHPGEVAVGNGVGRAVGPVELREGVSQ